MLLVRELKQDIDLLVAHPLGSGADDRRPGPIAPTLDLTALEREDDVVAARISPDLLEPGAEQGVQQIRMVDGRRPENDLPGQELVERVDPAGVPGDAQAGVDVGAS